MRISDWSSDVCSSDLPGPLERTERVVADIIEHIELVIALGGIGNDEPLEEFPQSGKVAVDAKIEIHVIELEIRIVERHELIGAVGKQADTVLRPLQVHRSDRKSVV